MNSDKKRTGVLMLHGFGGKRSELEPLRAHIEKLGYTISMPLLPGHEASKRELARAKNSEWKTTAQNAYDGLAQNCERVIVIGFSMGGMLGINLCQSNDISGLVIINMPIYVWDIKRIIKNILSDFKQFSKKYIKASAAQPLPSLVEFLRTLNATKPIIKNITCPTLILQAMDDDTAHHKSAEYIYNHISHTRKSIKIFEEGGHVIFDSSVGEEVCKSVEKFIESI